MNQGKNKILFISIFTIFAALLCILINNAYSKKLVKIVSDEDWLRENVQITTNISIGSNVLSVYKNNEINVYSLEYQKIIDEKLEELKQNKYSFKKPLLIYNLYGTNKSGIYMYFKEKNVSYMKYEIIYDEQVKNYENTLIVNNTTNHEYQITGLIIGKTQDIKFTIYDENDEVIDTKTITVFIPDSMPDIRLDNTIEYDGNNLYALMGYNINRNSNIYLYDSYGFIRGEIPLESYYACNLIKIDNNIFYNYSQDKFALVNNMSKVINIYKLEDYNLNNDFDYDTNNNRVIMAVKKKDGNNNLIIAMDINTGEISELIDIENKLNSYDNNINIDAMILKDNTIIVLIKELNSIAYFDLNTLNLKYIISSINNNSIDNIDYSNGSLITYESNQEEHFINTYKINENNTLELVNSFSANENTNSSYIKTYDDTTIILSNQYIEEYNNGTLVNSLKFENNKKIKKITIFDTSNFWNYN